MGVIRAAEDAGVARETHIKDLNDKDLEAWVRSKMYDPHSETKRVENEVRSMVADLPNGQNTESNGKIKGHAHL